MRRSRFPLVVTIGVLVFFYLPILILVLNSFNAARFGGNWKGFTFKWYVQLFHHDEIWRALQNTLIVAVSATLVSMVLGTLAALALHRYHTRLQRLHLTLIYTPLVFPDILMGMSLLLFFIALGVKLGLVTIFLAHVTFCISYVAMVVLSRLQDFDYQMIEAAQDLGADAWQAARRVMLPLLAPGIAAGGLLAFTLSIDDFVISFFVAGAGSTTLPIRIYSMIKHGSPAIINALSTLMLIFTFSLILISQRLLEEKKS
ncbi:MAG: ABC transporter permease subunit [candidate division KSB1 bacterium]|nr:ABC transporter permease subunit [candidate division KSB1 bacterium]MDZ7345404.1 ABC transporter permease subunit [candidate division KSB1 bacterium]